MGYSVAIFFDQTNAPAAESAAQATWEDLADIIGSGSELLVQVYYDNEWGERAVTLWSVSDTGAAQIDPVHDPRGEIPLPGVPE